jgi:hypothetical protein
MSMRLTCVSCGESLEEDEFEYCDPCLLDMEDADTDVEPAL